MQKASVFFPSRPSRPRVPVCFKCMSALETSVIVMGGIGGADCMCLMSQNSFSEHKSFDFVLLTVIAFSVIVEK